jgi:NADH-quinone oxidoreductase subunit B
MIKLQEKIDKQSISKVRWYRKGPDTVEVPVPILGPDLIDPRRNREIQEAATARAKEGVSHGDNASSH